ncbi:DoxX family protein [Xanthovirga aplysinae]|uniref:DoxX family protein n=1 Tax=Xanthovirga aplysinae TaxID=2529853 RepID=UPI0012BCC740|nr:DoxX family protein [Xanthovirga aplysinae]MTI29720.1 DoxX family protein [Xanthovirga aplysinae]
MKKRDTIIYRVVTVLFSLLMLMSAGMYFAQYEMVSKVFLDLGYPTHIIYPLAIAKLLGLVAIWTNKSRMLKEWAYAGFVFDLLLGVGAHLNISDGGHYPAMIGLFLVGVSYSYSRKLNSKSK